MHIKKKLIVFLLTMVMAVSATVSGYAASSVNLVVTETSRSKETDRKYEIKYSGTYVGSIDACSYLHTALLSFKTTGIIQYYTEKTKMTINYYVSGYPGETMTEYHEHTGTANGNKSECYRSLEYNQYMRSLGGIVSLDGFWSYSVQANDNADH